jgi:hypothetical protein
MFASVFIHCPDSPSLAMACHLRVLSLAWMIQKIFATEKARDRISLKQ